LSLVTLTACLRKENSRPTVFSEMVCQQNDDKRRYAAPITNDSLSLHRSNVSSLTVSSLDWQNRIDGKHLFTALFHTESNHGRGVLWRSCVNLKPHDMANFSATVYS